MPLFGPSKFESIRDTKLGQRSKALDKAEKALAEIPIHAQEDIIVATPIQELAGKIKVKEWSSLEVVAAFARRCLAAQKETNCLTEGPLHGVPFTLKDTFAVEGYDNSIGISIYANQPAQKSSVLYTTLTQLGAILLGKTNVPQTLLSFECNNPLFGETHNPFVKGFTSGGSSGGEGVVLALNASAIGFGSDIGGSLRIPAGWCGIYSLKPTKGRFTTRGHHILGEGFEGIPFVAGPMGRNIPDLIFLMKIILREDISALDSGVIPNPWKDSLCSKYANKEKLKFGYYFDDGLTIASPPVKRAVLMTAKALQAQGHEVVEIVPPNVTEMVHIFAALTTYDGYGNLRRPISQDPMEPTVNFLLTLGRIPNFLRRLLAFVIQYFLRDPVSAAAIRLAYPKTGREMASWVERRNSIRHQWNDWFHNNHFDALIAPTSSVPAPKINGTKMTGALATSTLIYNVLEWPVGCVPVTKVGKMEEMEESRWKNREGYSWMFLDYCYGKGKMYDDIAKGGEGLPVGVQVVGGVNGGEEGVLAIMERVDDALKSARGSD